MSGALARIAIDPGVAGRGCAIAWSTRDGDGTRSLVGARFVAPHEVNDVARLFAGAGAYEIVVERPEYQGDRSLNSRVQDLLALSWTGARLAYYLAGSSTCSVVEYTPREWKRAARKPQHHAQLFNELTFEERDLLGGDETARTIQKALDKGAADRWKRGGGAAYYPRGWDTHNLLDAAALLLTREGRLKL